MSYDIAFTLRADQTPLSVDALRAWFEARPSWRWYDWGAAYNNEDTGTDLRISVDSSDKTMSLSMSGAAAHTTGQELVEEIRAFVEAFELDVEDPQSGGEGPARFDADKLLAGWNGFNEFVTKVNHLMLQQPVPPHAAAQKLERVFAWNRQRAALEAGDQGDELFVPKISFAKEEDGTASTFVAWVGGAGLLPVVDSVLHPLRRVPFAALAATLAAADVHALPAPHYRVEGALAEALDAAITGADETLEMPTIVPPHAVRTTEVVQPYLAKDGGLENADHDGLMSRAGMAHHTGDAKGAFEAARRALALDATSQNAALLAAINGYYIAEFDEALRCVDALLAIAPDYKTGHIIRCGVLTDLARYDEAVAAADAALAEEGDAMVENMKGDALAGAGQTAQAVAAYERALALLVTEIEASPEDGDLISRQSYALIGLGRAKEALTVARRALKLVSDPLLTLQTIGRAELALGKPQRAVDALKKIDRSKRAVPLASFTLALAYAQLDRREAAAGALHDARRSAHFRNRIAAEPLLRDL